jgi:hypothetical protein
MINGNNIAYNLMRWHGVADLSTLTAEAVRTQILEPYLQDGPIMLRPTNFNLGNANIDTTAVMETIHTKVLKLGFKHICGSIFTQLCLGYSNQPHAALEHSWQTSIGPDSQPVTATVIKYYQQMMNAAWPFASQHHYAISVCNMFTQGLDKTLLLLLQQNYANHSTVHDLDGAYQCRMLPVILAAAHEAEDARNQIQDIACGMLASQGFFSTIVSDASAYASQVKKTIGYYKDGEQCKRLKLRCWGCGGNHSWMKRGKIVCPRGTDAADQQYTEFKEEQAKCGNKLKGRGKRTVKYKVLDEKSKKKMCKRVLPITVDKRKAALSVTTTSLSTAPKPGPAVFTLSTLSVPVFNTTPPPCRILPVPIQATLPHITLQLGTTLGCSNCPPIRCVNDTAAALTTGNLHFSRH